MKVIIKKRIHSCFASASSNDIMLSRVYDLPFAPFVGLEVVDNHWSDILREVAYDVSKSEFHCYVDADDEFYQRARRSGNPFRDAAPAEMQRKADGYIAEGWTQEK